MVTCVIIWLLCHEFYVHCMSVHNNHACIPLHPIRLVLFCSGCHFYFNDLEICKSAVVFVLSLSSVTFTLFFLLLCVYILCLSFVICFPYLSPSVYLSVSLSYTVFHFYLSLAANSIFLSLTFCPSPYLPRPPGCLCLHATFCPDIV